MQSKSLQSNNTINLVDYNGIEIPLPVLIVPTIVQPLKYKHDKDTHNLPHLKGLKLAHLFKDGVLNIDLLMGADLYWHVAQDRIVRADTGSVAMQSRVGYLLSGPTTNRELKGYY